MEAVRYGAGSAFELFLDHGADLHTVDEDKITVLRYASEINDEPMVENIIDRGLSADVEDKNALDTTPCGSMQRGAECS